MLISTRGRYALRFLVDLAENQGEEDYIPMKDIADRQEISHKYAERLLGLLSKGNFVSARHGKGGGYRLKGSPGDYRISEILRAMDEELAPVACLACKPNECHRAPDCRTLPMWQRLESLVTDFFDGITLADLVKQS